MKNDCPHIVVGTPGRILALAREKDLSLKNVRHFILDECDKMLDSLGRLLFLDQVIIILHAEYVHFAITFLPLFVSYQYIIHGSVIFLLIYLFLQICVEMCRRSSK